MPGGRGELTAELVWIRTQAFTLIEFSYFA